MYLGVSGPCHVGDTSSHSCTEVKQHWAWIVLGRETTWELQVLLTKTKAGLCCGSMQAKQMGGKLFQGWESLDCVLDSLLVTAAKRSHQVLAS